jgi:hypothetical protein
MLYSDTAEKNLCNAGNLPYAFDTPPIFGRSFIHSPGHKVQGVLRVRTVEPHPCLSRPPAAPLPKESP